MRGAIRRFRTGVAGLHLPATAIGAGNRVDDDASQMESLMRQLATINDASRYQQTAARFQAVGSQFDRDEANLRLVLRAR